MFKKQDKAYWEFDNQDMGQVEWIFQQIWHDRGEMGGRIWFEVFQILLEKRGFEIIDKSKWIIITKDDIEKNDPPEAGDVPPEDQT